MYPLDIVLIVMALSFVLGFVLGVNAEDKWG